MKDKSRASYIDNLRAIAIIAVIALHAAAPALFLLFDKQGAQPGWWAANFYDSISRFCVPVFVMITGALLLPQVLGLREFLQKRLKRILTPFIFWSLVYLIFFLALKVRDEGVASLQNIAPWIGTQLLQGTATHLWYVYMLIGLYLFIPIIKPWVQTASNKAILYFLIIWLITLIIGQQKIIRANTSFDLSYFGGFMGYLILGYYIADRIVLSTAKMVWATLLFVSGFLITFFCTYFLGRQKGIFSESFYEYLTVNVMMMAVGIFILLKGWNPRFGPWITVCRDVVSRNGFGIYLNHFLVLSVLSHFKVDYSFLHPIASIPIITFLCLASSTLLVYILHRLPYGKYISG